MNPVSPTIPYIEMTPTEPFDVAALLKELA
jgi:hypothetical protein